MKIESNINHSPIINSSAKINSSPAVNRQTSIKQKKIINREIQNSILANLNKEKTLSDALSIAQMSQSIIQKAINISSKLKNIASTAMITGKINSIELNQAINEIDVAVAEFGEKITAPAQTFQNNITVSNDNQKIDIDFNSIKQYAVNIKDNKTNENVLDNTLYNLNTKQLNIRSNIDKLKKSMQEIGNEYQIKSNNFQNNSSDIQKLIVNNSSNAIFAQGNINHNFINQFL